MSEKIHSGVPSLVVTNAPISPPGRVGSGAPAPNQTLPRGIAVAPPGFDTPVSGPFATTSRLFQGGVLVVFLFLSFLLATF